MSAVRRSTVRKILVRSLGAIFLGAFLGLAGLWLFRPFPEECLENPPPQSTLLVDRNGDPLRVLLGSDGSFSLWQPLDAFGEWLPNALIAAEDKRFRSHCGIDPLALLRAVRQNVTNMRRISGASTISTQVIRLAQPRRRVLSTKFIELFLATQMERRHTKDEILEQYLNRAPFGGNFTGAEAASRRYFGKRARDLTLAEAALLAGLPQSPTRHRPDIHPESARKRRAYVLGRMLELGFITEERHREALAAPLPERLFPYPFLAPHFCDSIIANWPDSPPTGTVRTTLDLTLQRMVQEALRDHVASLPGVHGGAVVLLDTATGKVLAWVGSPDYRDNSHAGQYDAVLAWRSPGSALKPFAYALALDQGRLTPATAIADLPRQYLAFAPGNFDGTHHGVVPARDALVRSLNSPALDLVRQCGIDAFLRLLHDFGIWEHGERSREHNGLGVVIGNTEVRPLDLAGAYALLGRLTQQGTKEVPRPEPQVPSQQQDVGHGTWDMGLPRGGGAVSAPAAWIVLDMLSGDERADVETGGVALTGKRRRTAWKTGTSAGFRDAWTCAVTPSYTLCVWLGNPDGRPAQALVGIEAAAPLAFRILRQLPLTPDTSDWFERPDGVVERSVCAASGLRPNPDCPVRIPTWAIRDVTLQSLCEAHRPDADGDGAPEEVWPENIQAYRRGAATRGTVAPAPAILSPAPNAVLRAGPIDAGDGRLPFRARGTGTLYWFLDGEFLAEAPASEPVLWNPVPGRHRLRCAAEDGAVSTCDFEFR